MDYNLIDIKNELISNCKRIFDDSTAPTYEQYEANFTFDAGIDAFFRVVLFKTNIHKLDGLPKSIFPALQEALISRKGDLNSLKIIVEELEPFLKKIVFIKSNLTIDYSDDHTKTLIPLLKLLALSQNLNNGNAYLSDDKLESFKGQNEFLYYLCGAYLARNQVHNSPNWNLVEVATNLQSTLVVYLYSVFKYLSTLKPHILNVPLPSQTTAVSDTKIFEDPKFKPLYDFMSYNHTTYEIRTEIVKSYILHFLSSQTGKVKIDEIQKKCNMQFKTSTDKNFYDRTLRDLIKKKKILMSGINNDEFEIDADELQRIREVKDFFQFQREMFVYELTEVLKKYNIAEYVEVIIAQLTTLFEKNYNIDIKHIIERGIEIEDNAPNLVLFFKHLKHVYTQPDVENLLKDIMAVCGSNNFIHRVTASNALSKVSDLSEIDQYLRQQERIVYLDTSVLLYSLCYWYESSKSYDNVYYKVVKDLVDYSADAHNIKLKTAPYYLAEVAFHFKEALLLAPIDEIGLFSSVSGSRSNNVFFNFYLHLKEESLLDDHVNNFFDFLNEFNITEDLLDDDKLYISRVSQIIIDILQGDHIGVDIIPHYPCNPESAFEEFKNALKYPRPTEVINNDAKMICFLSDRSMHLTEPIFATWDTTFFTVRAKYLKKHKGLQMWHLFTPSKLINHFQLLDFKIDAESATNDYLTIIDNLHEKTKSTLDAVSDLLSINKDERRRYINKLREFNQKYVFNLTSKEDGFEEDSFDQKPVEKLLVEINKHYHQKSSSNYNDVKSVLGNKDLFDQVVSIFETELEHFIKKRDFTETLFTQIDALVEENKKRVSSK